MNKILKNVLGLFVYISLNFPCNAYSAPMKIIKDYGNTRPSGLPTRDAIRALAEKVHAQPQDIVQFTPYIFPVRPKIFHLGNLDESIAHGVESVPYPFVIIGSERESIQWLERNKQYLLSAGVSHGLVTAASGADAFKQVNDVAESMNIKLNLMNADELTKIFNVNVYPILITKKEVLQ